MPPRPSAEEVEICRQCGARLVEKTPCPACLLQSGLDLLSSDDAHDSNQNKGTDNGIAESAWFGEYELLEEIGRGGQGVVYRARQKKLNRIVALKIIGLGHWTSEANLKRFRLEAEAAAGLDHPGIVPIYEVGERDRSCYFSMKFIEGGQLDEVVKQESLSLRDAVKLMVSLARTVHYAHERGVLHRDIKPGNVLLDRRGQPHLTDFGLARLVEEESNITRTHQVLGTPSYIAPEQAASESTKLSAATDVYGLGAVFYQLLTGQPPFAGGTTFETVKLVLETEPRKPRLWNPKVDRELETICLKCLEKDPRRRYPTAVVLAEDLERWLRHEPIQARRSSLVFRARKWTQRNPTTAVLAPLVILLGMALAATWWNGAKAQMRASGIAVLPFENLSATKENASFADGIQDDILTKLGKIGDLKVISRTSVMSYRGARDTREIGRALNVSHLLEGSVRRQGDRVHLNTQLIDTRSDKQVWAEEYDRDLNDIFTVQSDIAQKVAEQLHVKVSSGEKSAIERPPTVDIAAFDSYTQARTIFLGATNSNSGKEDLLAAADLLNQALALDPFYFEAYCQLAAIHDLLYLLGHDHTPRRLSLAESAVSAALRLRPNAAETHLARATHLYSGYWNYHGALAELELARKSLPSDCRVFELAGLIKYRQGRFEEAVPEFEDAVKLDPRNVYRLVQLAEPYWFLRGYSQAEAIYQRALAIEPKNVQVQIIRADLEFLWKADSRPIHQVIDSIRENNPRALHEIADSWVGCSLADRDPVSARAALIVAGENTPFNDNAVHFNRAFVEGWIARLQNDEVKARAAFEEARAEQARVVEAQPDYAPSLCVLGVIDAMLGRKEEALRESRRAVELLPVQRDAINGPLMIQWYAVSAAWVGDKNLALEQLSTLSRVPGANSYGPLKLLPFWDPLRGEPRFEQIVNALAPK